MSSIDNDFFVFKFTQNGLRVYEKHELKIFLKKFFSINAEINCVYRLEIRKNILIFNIFL